MLEQINSQTITVSPAAAKAVVDLLTEKELEGYALRVYVAGGGCCSVQFGMALDNNFREVDKTIDAGDIKVVVDDVSMEYLKGASIDYINDPQRGTGFTINSPNAKAHSHGEGSCGCGSTAGSGGCGGGSCGCN
ncbi:MAG: hypothetical protein Kow002_12190 [Anaerolineales bacterium]